MNKLGTKLVRMYKTFWQFPDIVWEIFFRIVDNVEVLKNLEKRKTSAGLILPFLLFCYLTFIFLLYKCEYDLDHLCLVHHVIFRHLPESFIRKNDFGFCALISAEIFITSNLIYTSLPHLRFIMSPNSNHSKISGLSFSLSKKLSKFQKQIQTHVENFSTLSKCLAICAATIPSIGMKIFRIFFVAEHETKFRVWFCNAISLLLVAYFDVLNRIGF